MTAIARPPQALLDANVLYGSELRDLLLTLAEPGLLKPRWTHRIQQEWTDNLLRNRPDITAERLQRTTRLMAEAFPEALVAEESYLQLQATLGKLPDPGDAHVIAAAIASNSNRIVTHNIKHFPAETLEPHGVKAVSPDEFLLELLLANPDQFCAAVDELLKGLKRPVTTPGRYINRLAQLGLVRTADTLHQHWKPQPQ